ncbi:MAG: HAD family hydrolase, partial [Chitinophagales bacterium]|jgi:phosphoglycolate phosphatase
LVESSNLSFEEYWDLKRNKINHYKILTSKFNYTQDQYNDFENKWMCEIELKKWLDLDTPFEGVNSLLAQLSERHSLYIVTARQSIVNTMQQLEGFGWYKYISSTLITEQKNSKTHLIWNSIKVSPEDWFIGDTGKDIEAGKELGIRTAAVLTGFLNKQCLEQYQPDIIIEKATKIIL